jgi:hypothetical protein
MTATPIGLIEASATLTLRRPKTRSRVRRRLIALAVVATTFCGLGLWGRNRLEQHLRQKLLPTLSQHFGRNIEVGEINFGFGNATVSNIRVNGPQDAAGTPLVLVDEAEVDVDLRSLLSGEVVVKHIAVKGVAADLRRSADGTDNISDLLQTLMGKSGDETKATPGQNTGRLRMNEASLSARDIQLTVNDASTGATLVLVADKLTIDSERELDMSGVDLSTQIWVRSQRASVDLKSARVQVSPDGQVRVSADQVHTASTDPRLHALLEQNSASKVYVERVRSQSGEWQLNLMGEIESPLQGQGGETDAETFLVSTTLPKAGGAELRVSASNVKLARFAPLATRFAGLAVEDGSVSGEWTIRATRRDVQVFGDMELGGVAFSNRRLAKQPVKMKPTLLSGLASFDRQRGSLQVAELTATSGGVPYQLTLEGLLPGYPREDHPAPRLAARVTMPEVPCQDMLASLPTGLAPQLEGFELKGSARGELFLKIDWSDFELTKLDMDMDMDRCQVVRAPQHMSAGRLNGSFEHRVPVPGGWKTFIVGAENDAFVPLRKVSRNLKRSFLTTEDSAFYRHEGFITKEFRGALVKNLKRGRFAYGASSISMQVVKNVLLSREKTISRKLQELFLTWHIENALTKDRILEIYVNAIEFGPGLYGIGPAARQYFAKHPRTLNPVESAFLASLLPAPTKRYKQYCGGYVRRSTSAKIERILGFMHRRKRLDEEQYAAALETPLSFRGRRSALCRQSKPKKEGRNS